MYLKYNLKNLTIRVYREAEEGSGNGHTAATTFPRFPCDSDNCAAVGTRASKIASVCLGVPSGRRGQ